MLQRRDQTAKVRTRDQGRPSGTRRKRYARPELTVYGRLPELTSGYGGSKAEAGTYFT